MPLLELLAALLTGGDGGGLQHWLSRRLLIADLNIKHKFFFLNTSADPDQQT
jgi:hypothetical protein